MRKIIESSKALLNTLNTSISNQRYINYFICFEIPKNFKISLNAFAEQLMLLHFKNLKQFHYTFHCTNLLDFSLECIGCTVKEEAPLSRF